jgi:hypothetical protein
MPPLIVFHVLFAIVATLRGHGSAPWALIGQGYLWGFFIGYLLGSFGVHPIITFYIGVGIGWIMIIFLFLMMFIPGDSTKDERESSTA